MKQLASQRPIILQVVRRFREIRSNAWLAVLTFGGGPPFTTAQSET